MSTNVNEKLKAANYNYNKNSFLGSFVFSSLSCFTLGVIHLRNGKNMIGLFFFVYSIAAFYSLIRIEEFLRKSSKSLEYFFNILCGFSSIFLPIFIILAYYFGKEYEKIQKMYFISIGIMNIIFSTRQFNSKESSNLFALIYSMLVIFLTYLFYYLYGKDKFYQYFDSIDLIYSAYTILMIFLITYCKNIYYEYYNKAIWENEFMTEKFNNMFKYLIIPIIKIDTGNFNIELNDNIIIFFKKILGNNEDLKGFLDISEVAIKYFKDKTMITQEYKQFYNNLHIKNESNQGQNINFSQSSINKLNLFDINDSKKDIFLKRFILSQQNI